MDASRYARAVRRHALLVVVTVTLAVAVTVALLLFLPQRYRATADVVVLLPDTQTGSLLATTAQAVSDFEGAIRSSAVSALTAEEAGVPASSVSDGLETEPLAGGTIVEVTFTGSDPDVAETIVTTASREAILLLLDARLGPVSQRLDAAQRAMTEANEAYEAFITETELIDPEEFFFQQQRRLANLQEEQDQAEIAGDDEEAASIQELISELLQVVAPLRTEFDALRTGREQAAAGLQEARGAFATADASRQAAEEASSITVLPATKVPRTERLPSQLLVVVVIATALTIGMIVLLELLAPQRLTRDAAARPSEAEPEGRAAAVTAAAGGRPDAARPAASVPVRVASERAPRAVDAAQARPGPAREEPAPVRGPQRPEAAPTKAPATVAPNRARSTREPFEGSAAGAVSDPREPVSDRAGAERTATSGRGIARGPAPDRAATTHEAARPVAGPDGAARTASAPSPDRAPAAGAPDASAPDAASLGSGGAQASSDGGSRSKAKPSTSSEPAKRSRGRSKKPRSRAASDAAPPTADPSQSARGVSTSVETSVEPPKPPASDAGHVPAGETGAPAPPKAAERDASRPSETGTSGRKGTPTKKSRRQRAAPSQGAVDSGAAGEGRSASEASSVGITEVSRTDAASPTSLVGGGDEQVPAAEKASDEGMIKATTKQRRSDTGRQGRAVTTEASGDDRDAPAKAGVTTEPSGDDRDAPAKAADASSAVDPEVEGGPTREPPAKAEKVETSRGEDADDPSRSAARRDRSSEQEDRSRPTEDAAAEK